MGRILDRSTFVILFSCLILTGCGLLSANQSDSADSREYSSQEQALLQDMGCPQVDLENYYLWLSHYAALNIDPGNGETFFLEFQNLDPIPFDLWIDSDGTVSNEGRFKINLNNSISYQGVANHPDSDDCPVQTFEGSWRIKASISGTCVNDVVHIHVIEEWVDPVLESDCGGPFSPGTGLYSAPEVDLTFNLKDEIPSDSIVIGGSGPFTANYTYYLWPQSEEELPLVPLVPEQ